MTTFWVHYWLLLRSRLLCRVIPRRHAPSARVIYGYHITFCTRCWGYSVDRVAP